MFFNTPSNNIINRIAAFLFSISFITTSLIAQPQPENKKNIELNFGPHLELKVLIDFVSQQLDMKLLYDESVENKRITLKIPSAIPEDTLFPILQSALKMKGLAVIDTDAEWKRIIPIKSLSSLTQKIVVTPLTSNDVAAYDVVTHLISLQHMDAKQALAIIQQFLTMPGGSAILIQEQNAILVTDYNIQLEKVLELVHHYDQPGIQISIELIALKHVDAAKLAEQLSQIETQKRTITGSLRTTVSIKASQSNNQLIVIGEPHSVREMQELVNLFDYEDSRILEVYTLQYTKPEKLESILANLYRTGRNTSQHVQITRDDETASLIVLGSELVHQKIRSLVKQFDIEPTVHIRPIRRYKLEHATAAEVHETVQAVAEKGYENVIFTGEQTLATSTSTSPATSKNRDHPQTTTQSAPSNAFSNDDVVVTVDDNTNSIIVIGPEHVQAFYKKLISMLDVRRPQVLIECTIITVDRNADINLGVELGGEINVGDGVKSSLFTSFGLSEIESGTSTRTIKPTAGFNGTVIKTDVADIIIQALKKNGNSRVLSMPRLLVNDNESGRIASTLQSPTTSINSSDTVATTSFNNYVDAGTTIEITPHIAEGDHLRLEYAVELSSFTSESSSDGIPPPRQNNSINSVVTVPDAHTIIVGGVHRTDTSNSKAGVPILGEIPVLEYLFGSREDKDNKSIMYVFMRPVIMRANDFSDLKYFSSRSIKDANLSQQYPASSPIIMP
ncbi:secretin N-terminal domain-containing protein [Poriferisphaera sp. WC338]|uniref:secretin N-terminal domain-containing protein n=1 Tax=Poriferisphaera sp. WC338 TaxID=3425129 RepID=UPI003D814ADE